jgi:hypothetical protein
MDNLLQKKSIPKTIVTKVLMFSISGVNTGSKDTKSIE